METLGPHSSQSESVEAHRHLGEFELFWIKNVLKDRVIDDDTAYLQSVQRHMRSEDLNQRLRYLDIDASGLTQLTRELDAKIHARLGEGLAELNDAISRSQTQVKVLIGRTNEAGDTSENEEVLLGFASQDGEVVPVTETGIILDASYVRMIDAETD